MLDPFSLLAGAAIAGAGYLAGRRNRREKASVPMCSCRHGLNEHDPETGRCHARIEMGTKPMLTNGRPIRDAFGEVEMEMTYGDCTCRRYIGPKHIVDVWVPPLPKGDDR